MTWQVAHPATDEQPWQLWNADPGEPSYSANFYTPTEPYQRKHYTITHMSLAAKAEQAARDDGYVTLVELDDAVVEHWAESDAKMLAAMVFSHIVNRDGP